MKEKDLTNKEKEYITENIPSILAQSFVNLITDKYPNEVVRLKGGYISYNPNTDTGEETALCYDGTFYILLGDYRKNLKGCKTIKSCIKIFDKLLSSGAKESIWSTK